MPIPISRDLMEGFWLPPDSGEKITLGITVLLAFSVFMLLIAENIPATSEMVPLIGIYLTVTMSLTSMSIVLTVLVLQLHHAGPFAPTLPRNFYYFMTRRVACYIGMTSTVERYELLKVKTSKRSSKEEECRFQKTSFKKTEGKKLKSVEENLDDSDYEQESYSRVCCCCPAKDSRRRAQVVDREDEDNFKEFQPKRISSKSKPLLQDDQHYDNQKGDFTQIEISVDLKSAADACVDNQLQAASKIPFSPTKTGPNRQVTALQDEHRASQLEINDVSAFNSPNRLIKSGTAAEMTPARVSQSSQKRLQPKSCHHHCSCQEPVQPEVPNTANLTPLKIVQLKSLKNSPSQTTVVPSSPHTSKHDHQNQHSHHHHHYHHHHHREAKFKCSSTSSPSITLIGNNSFNLRANNLATSTKHSHGDNICGSNNASFAKKCSCTYKKEYIDAIEKFTKSVNSYLARQDHDASRNNLQNEWKLVALIVDRVLFWSFTVLTVVSSVILLIVVPVLKNRDLISAPTPTGTPPNPAD